MKQTDTTYINTFCRNLRYYMSIRGKSQADITRDLGIPQTTMSAYYRGSRFPRMNVINALADYLECTSTALIGTPVTLKKVVENNDGVPELEELINVAIHANTEDLRMAIDLLKRLQAFRQAVEEK